MEGFGPEVNYPTLLQICDINRRMIDSFGGLFVPPDNLQNQGSLEYILATVSTRFYGVEPYPTVKEKAAAIANQVIGSHTFWDGNKRTGVHLAWEFLHSNGVPLYLESSIVDLAVGIAEGNSGYEQLLVWLHSHQEPAP